MGPHYSKEEWLNECNSDQDHTSTIYDLYLYFKTPQGEYTNLILGLPRWQQQYLLETLTNKQYDPLVVCQEFLHMSEHQDAVREIVTQTLKNQPHGSRKQKIKELRNTDDHYFIAGVDDMTMQFLFDELILHPVPKLLIVDCKLDVENTLAKVLEQNTITDFYFGQNRVTHQTYNKIMDAIQHNHRMTMLNIPLPTDHDMTRALIHALSHNQSIQTLHIFGNNFVQDLSTLIRNNKTILNLDLGYTRFDNEAVRMIAEALSRNQTIIKLNLSNTDMTAEMIQTFANHINNHTILSLTMTDIWMQDDGVQALVLLLEHTSLTELDISRNWFGRQGFDMIYAAVQQNPYLVNVKIDAPHLPASLTSKLERRLQRRRDLIRTKQQRQRSLIHGLEDDDVLFHLGQRVKNYL